MKEENNVYHLRQPSAVDPLSRVRSVCASGACTIRSDRKLAKSSHIYICTYVYTWYAKFIYIRTRNTYFLFREQNVGVGGGQEYIFLNSTVVICLSEERGVIILCPRALAAKAVGRGVCLDGVCR